MKRKEVYATTGTRIAVRVFAGWDFTADEVHRPDFARTGYSRGVPMGGDLRQAPDSAAPDLAQPPSCAQLFGEVGGFLLCEERPDSCELYHAVLGATSS